MLVCSLVASDDLQKVRTVFKTASKKESNAKVFHQLMQNAQLKTALKQAYLGASETILSKFGKSVSEKMSLFKSGKNHLEKAIATAPKNIEIRMIRLVIQTQSPAFLNYNKAIQEDKTKILNNFENLSKDLQQYIIKINDDLSIFTASERKQLN